MKCHDCGYMLDPFEKECPRCKRIGTPKQKANTNNFKHILYTSITIFISVVLVFGVISLLIPDTTTISGEVFIVTNGQESIKLAATDIDVYEYNNKTKVYIDSLQQKYDSEFDANLHRCYQKTDIAAKNFINGNTSYDITSQEELEDLSALFDGSFFYNNLPDNIKYTCQTDANGKFYINVLSNRQYILCARSSRMITDDDVEHYYWIVLLDINNEPTKYNLNNSNMTESKATENAVRSRNFCNEYYTLLEDSTNWKDLVEKMEYFENHKYDYLL